jgi:hypothetical protein
MKEIEKFSGVVKHVVKDKEVVLYVTCENGNKETRRFPSTLFDNNVKADDEFNGVITSGSGWMQIDFIKKEDEEKSMADATYENLIKNALDSEEDIKFVEKCKQFAISCHKKVNQMYDGKPYSYHLNMGVDFALMFIDLIPRRQRANVIGGMWNHDTIEDTGITLNYLIKATNQTVGNISYALTNEKGKTRAERANAKYYRGIRNEIFADYCKLCDRMANVKHSIIAKHSYKGEGMFAKYKKEQPKFIWGIIKPEWHELQEHIIHLFMGHKNYLRYRKSNHEYAPMILHLDNMLNKGEL